ncbi:hypothetical protein OG21DRAFT_1481909 [Imleria badia]|nr:hypothetical protein OG21DRAFT_1481909 [Imleria badia]
MFPERLWSAFRFVPWEDTFHFHARLFRCFLLGLVDAHSDLAFASGSKGPAWMWAVLGKRLADVGLGHDAGHLHEQEPVPHPVRCPPRRRYEATSWPAFVTNMPMDQTVLPSVPQPIYSHNDTTRGLHNESAVVVDIPGLGHLLGGYDDGGAVMLGCLLSWLFILAIVVLRRRIRWLHSTRAVCRLSGVAVDATTSERGIRRLLWDRLAVHEVAETHDQVGHRASMPGAWLVERREQSMLDRLEESVLEAMSGTLFQSCALMGIMAWVHFFGLTEMLAALDPLDRGSNGVVTIGRQPKDGRSPGVNESGLDAGASTSVMLDETKLLGAPLDSESSLIKHVRDSTMVVHDRRAPLAISDVVVKQPGSARMATLDVVSGDQNVLLVASSNADRGSYQEDVSSDGDASPNEDGSDEGLFGIGTRRADVYRDLGRRQDGALSDTGYARTLRRARSTGYLWLKRDISDDDDEGTGDDSYWTEQVNARLSGKRDTRHEPCRYGLTDGSSWPREGREDGTDNWRTRSSQIIHVAAQVDDNSTKLRRYSSPSLSVNASLSHRADSGDGPQGVYVVPQRRGDRCWSPVSSPRPSGRPSGLGFFPLGKTPPLLTPEAWRPGCLYMPDPPVDEPSQADAWWDGLTCGAASAGGQAMRPGPEMPDDLREQGSPFSRDGREAPVSWRDRHENDPASRRIISAHRRATTEG